MKIKCCQCKRCFELDSDVDPGKPVVCPCCNARLIVDLNPLRREMLSDAFKAHKAFPVFIVFVLVFIGGMAVWDFDLVDIEINVGDVSLNLMWLLLPLLLVPPLISGWYIEKTLASGGADVPFSTILFDENK